MKSHRTDTLSLIFAVLFLAAAAWWVLARQLDQRLPDAGWFVVGGVGLLGVLGLTAALRRGRDPEAAAVPAEPAEDDETAVDTDDPAGERVADA